MATRTNKTASVSINEEVVEVNQAKRYFTSEITGQRYDNMEYDDKGNAKGVPDWSYLLDKEAGSNVHIHIELMKHFLGEEGFAKLLEDPAKFAQAYLAKHRYMQQHAANKDRDGYRATTRRSVIQRTETLLARQAGLDETEAIGVTRGHHADEAKPKAAQKSRARKTPTPVAPATEASASA